MPDDFHPPAGGYGTTGGHGAPPPSALQPCPNCQRLIPVWAVLCTQCGYSFYDGEVLETETDAARKPTPKRSTPSRSEGMPWWVTLGALIALVMVVVIATFSTQRVFLVLSVLWTAAGVVGIIVGTVMRFVEQPQAFSLAMLIPWPLQRLLLKDEEYDQLWFGNGAEVVKWGVIAFFSGILLTMFCLAIVDIQDGADQLRNGPRKPRVSTVAMACE